MIIKKTKFKDLLIVKQKNNSDKRGSLRETFNDKILKKKFIFEYCTTSKKNVFRGFHFQLKNKQSKFITVLKGRILDVVIDLRKNSKTFGEVFNIGTIFASYFEGKKIRGTYTYYPSTYHCNMRS